ncbi:MAG: hypothetical protein KGJ07_06545 [Patescibacteria group bacterium]|nr:hypothetical protein [Patescibacteria group bacterium]
MKNKQIVSVVWISLVLLLIAVPIVLPFVHVGYFPSHDGEWAVVRLADMFREIRDHQFPPRYSGNLNFGYGYPLFNFAYPLPYYFGLLIYMFKFSFINSIKLVFAVSTFISVIFMYLASKEFWGNKWAGFASSLLFAYLPYRLVDLYVRGSIGETVAFAFFSFLFFCAVRMHKNPKQIFYVPLTGLAIAGLVLSHNIMATFFLPIFVLFFACLAWNNYKEYIVPFVSSVFLGIAVSAFFWLPALSEKHLILLSKIPIADRTINYVALRDLLFRPWGYGIPEAATGGFTYQIGWPQIIVFLIVAGFLIINAVKKKTFSEQFRTAIFLTFAVIVMTAMLFSFTNIIWKTVPLLKEINYPWTLLGPIGFIISFASGYLCTLKMKRVKQEVLVLGIFAVALYLPFAKPEKFTYYDNNYYATNDATTTSSSEYTPLWVTERPLQRPAEKVELISGFGTISGLVYDSKLTSFTVVVKQPVTARINTIYYPGWKVFVDGVNVIPSYANPRGVMDIVVPIGTHTVRAVFGETPLRGISDGVSIGAVLMCLGLMGFSLRKVKK